MPCRFDHSWQRAAVKAPSRITSRKLGHAALPGSRASSVSRSCTEAGTTAIRGGEAIRYTVAVGRPGKQWQGKARVSGKFVRPDWTPPAEVKADNPALPEVIPGGAPNNPMGVAAMTLSGGEYAIHGTNKPESIGKFASYGCIRMLNQDITDLFGRVAVGTDVVVLR